MTLRASSGVNIIRCLCRTWWGADPATFLILYKAYIRPHLDYGSIFLGGCARFLLTKLDKVQYRALRVVGAFMRSSPVHIILSECGKTALDFRRIWLASKFILKVVSYDNPIYSSIEQFYIVFLNYLSFWRRKYFPPILAAFQNTLHEIHEVAHNPLFPCHFFPLDSQISPTVYEPLNLGKEGNQTKFVSWYLDNWSEYKLIFTDGSKDEQGNVGIGIYLNKSTELTARLPSANSICSAELFAIKKALELIQHNDFEKSLICSDSKSALEKMTRPSYKAAADTQTLQLKQKLSPLHEQNKAVKFAWIQSHTGIVGNDRADYLAKLGRKLPVTEEPNASFKYFQTKYKENL
ncbi:uncharacterized protein [Diabrotica undecimpunctata]|uniref:uncharacterized protein n=1 Tax=Diabrotica undecimpunctata TaxID=50387 RepID=UPI003B632A17